ncbi:aldo/keto reductase [Cohnella hongkongensis]|uniref:Aldo/keto reductase n=1 Tax=Cohnella hongkongensis TaxID=178337 RepID=A0ABV9F8E7_9BACL
MKRRTIFRTDLAASVISLGTADLGGSVPAKESEELLNLYTDRGGNFLDTAEVYANWLPIEPSSSERFLGQWMKSRGNRNELILATKGGHPRLDAMTISRIDPASLTADLEGSLRRLGADHIDLYYLHRDDPSVPVETVVETLERFVREGKIRYYGCSNWTIPRIEQANEYARSHGYAGFVAVQNLWNLAEVNPGSIADPTQVVSDREFVEWHRRTGISAVPYSSQANGFFSGRYRRDTAADFPGSGVVRTYCSETNFARLERAERLARELGVTATQIALAYLLSHPFPVFPIVGSKKKEHLLDSLSAADVPLDDEAALSLIE